MLILCLISLQCISCISHNVRGTYTWKMHLFLAVDYLSSFWSFSRQQLWLFHFGLSFLLRLHLIQKIIWKFCGCCCKWNDSKKAWYSFSYLSFSSYDILYVYLVFSNTLPRPPTPPMSAGICKKCVNYLKKFLIIFLDS